MMAVLGILAGMRPDEAYIKERVRVTESGCWEWTRYVNHARGGYGSASWRDDAGGHRVQSSHRLAYEIFRGPVPPGLVLDHAACQNKTCCNPDHLEPVTGAENMRRAAMRGEASNQNRGKTVCGKCGHPFDKINRSKGQKDRRSCRTCEAAYHRAWRAKRKAGG